MSVGADVKHGLHAIHGAHCGVAHMWLDGLDPDLISDYDWLAARWQSEPTNNDIETLLDFDVPILSPSQSRWFKRVWWNPERHGLMIPE
jgi:hypothetical protein